MVHDPRGRLYPAFGHPEGIGAQPWFTIQDDKLYPAFGHPDGIGAQPWIQFLEGEAEDWARGRPLLGKRVQRHFCSGVSQLGGSLVEGKPVARGLILADLIGQAHHRVWIPQSCSLPKQFHGLIDAVLSATLLVQE
jgi:hypothetical protein